MLNNLIPAIEVIRQKNPDLKASKYSTLEDRFSDFDILGARKEKRLLRLLTRSDCYRPSDDERAPLNRGGLRQRVGRSAQS